MESQDFKNFNYNILGSKSVIKGAIILSGDAIINSELEGSIEVLGKGKLILERGSIIQGKIKAYDLEIFGIVSGEIDCEGLVSIRSSATVQGKVKSARLAIYPGAIVEMDAESQELVQS